MVTVQVYNRSTGTVAKGARVYVWPSGDYAGYDMYTNDSGEAHFASVSPGQAEVTINGNSVFKGRLEGRTVVYI